MPFARKPLLGLVLILAAAPLQALDTTQVSATGGQRVTLTDDTTVTIPNTAGNSRSGVVSNGAGSLVEAADGVVVTISIEDGYNTAYDIRGITASNNGTVVLGETHISVSGYGVYAANPGSSVILGDNSTVVTNKGRALFAQFTNITVGDDVLLSTENAIEDGAHAVYAYRDLSNIVIGDRARIVTGSAGSHGVLATNGGWVAIGDDARIELQYDDATNTATSGAGLFSSGIRTNPDNDIPPAHIAVGDNLSIATLAGYGYGMVANDQGTIATGGNVTITTVGNRATAIYTYDQGSSVTVDGDVHITTRGELARGLVAYLNGVLTVGSGSTIATEGFNAAGIYASVQGVVTLGGDSVIATGGDSSHAVYSYNDSSITLGDGTALATAGVNAYGMVATTAGSTIRAGDRLTITTTGDGGGAVNALVTGVITIGDGAVMHTGGLAAHGLVAQGAAAGVTVGEGMVVTTQGDNAYGAYAYNGGAVTVGGGATVATAGDAAHALFALGGGSDLTIGPGGTITTTGSQAHAVFAAGGGVITLTGDQSIAAGSGDDSYAMFAMGDSAGEISRISADGRLQIHGGIVAMDYGDIDVVMASGSSFEGFTSVESGSGSTLDLSMTGSTWMMADNFINGEERFVIPTFNETTDTESIGYSSQGDLPEEGADGGTLEDEMPAIVDFSSELDTGDSLEERTIATANPVVAGQAHSTLTTLTITDSTVDFTGVGLGSTLTTGTLSGSGGRFILKTDIATLRADHIDVTGSSSGSHILSIRDAGSSATTGTEIVPVVDTADGVAEFALDATVDAGGFEYDLRRTPGNTTNWELYSTGRASRPGSASINGFIGSYLLSNAETTSLMRRMGELRHDPGCGTGLWVRGHGGRYKSNHDRLLSGFAMNYGGFQIGADRTAALGGGARLFYGAMFGYADSRLKYPTGKSKIDAKTAGLYGSFLAAGGFYADAVVKYMWMRNDFDVLDNRSAPVKGRKIDTGGIGASLEVGNRFHLPSSRAKSGWYLEPQAQLSYTRQNGDGFIASNGLAVRVAPFNSLQGRLGLAAGYELPGTRRPQTLYAKGSVVKEFHGDIRARFNGARAATSFDDTWWEYGIGYAAQVGPHQHIYLDVEQSRGGRFRQPWAVNAGFRTSF